MKVWRFPTTDAIDSLKLREEDTPHPARGQVLVRMHAASLNYRDLMIATGRSARGAPLPDLIPLSDGAGEVVEIGPEVTVSRSVIGSPPASCKAGWAVTSHPRTRPARLAARSTACWASIGCSTSRVW